MGVPCVRLLPATALLGSYVTFGSASAQASCEPQVGLLVSVSGTVEVQRASGDQWSVAPLNETLCEGDTIRVGERSRAAVSLINEAVLRIDQSTTIRLEDITGEAGERSWLDLLNGAIQSFSRRPQLISVNTPYLNGSIEGTEFVMRVEDGATQLTVIEGVVTAANDQGSVSLSPGEAASASAGMAPERRIVVRPRDQVQWGLYYPPVLSAAGVADRSPELGPAAQCAAEGDTQCAFAALDQVPASRRDADFLLLRASLLLSVGQVEPAGAAIDEALRSDSASGDAYALRSIIGVALNDQSEAVAEANRAVDLSPSSAAARIAQSYALQSALDLQGAREALEQAVEQNPDNALAWARLAEIRLMLGDRRQATAAADRAAELDPDLGRTQTVRGFAALSEIRAAKAIAAFERAISLESDDPLPHLGLGLAKIRRGRLEDGRRDIEAAVALDSNNALLRAYLGKAYFEEKRAPLDAQQFAIAEELDPLDPTAFLYDAIRLQTENRPVEALRQLERSIELNDNRAVYRSQLLLDQDRAARGASLARIYQDLSFNQAGIDEASKSLSLDPANASAHRFLSDAYRDLRRTEISRVSELLQSQLLQDVNIYPVQPSIAATNLNIVTFGGPARPGFNEFTPLFQRNQTQLNVSAFGGNHDTYGGEAVVSGVEDSFSYSIGAFSYDSDGWRDNNALSQELYNVYLQGEVVPDLNLQLEFSRRESDEGDLQFNFDPDDFLHNYTLSSDRDSARFGARFSPTNNSDVVFSYIYGTGERSQVSVFPFDDFDIFLESSEEFDGHQAEGQYILVGESFNVVLGLAYSDSDIDVSDVYEERYLDASLDYAESFSSTQKVEHSRGYLYANIGITDGVLATLGTSYDDFRQDPISIDSFNPKFGLRWQISDFLSVQAAAFKVVKPSLVNNRTIEPTQVAGFNQFFDDRRGTEAWRYGVGFDARLSQNVHLGGEATWRDIREANALLDLSVDKERAFFEDQDEQFHSLYAYWTPSNRVAVSARVTYDRYRAEQGLDTLFGNRPTEITTVTTPLTVSYFHPSGLFGTVAGTYVDQEVRRSEESSFVQGSDGFFLVDAVVGYRLPKRMGLVTIGVKNLFDEDFRYQDDSFRESTEEPSRGPYFPTRFVLSQISLSF